MSTTAARSLSRDLAEQRIQLLTLEVHRLAVRMVACETAAVTQADEGRQASAEGFRELRAILVDERSEKLRTLNLERQMLRFGRR